MNFKSKELRKVYIILFLLFACGLLLLFSRSQTVLKAQKADHPQRNQYLATMENQRKTPQLTGDNYCIAYNSSSDYNRKLKANAEKALENMKKRTTIFDTKEHRVKLKDCNTTILATEHLKDLGSVEDIEKYVQNGGYVLFMSVLNQDSAYQILYRKLGISSFGDYVSPKGIHLLSNVLIGEKGYKVDDDFITNDSISLDLDDQTELLAESADKTPLLWKSKYGEGAFMVFNGTIMQEKISRGLFTGALSLLVPDYIYPVFNEKLFYIDDFPAPIPKGRNAAISKEYQRDIPSFYNEIWWPNMLKTAKKYGFKYTGGIIESYTDVVTPPFDSVEDKDSHYLIAFGRELLKSGGELGFHGFNHQSLVLDSKVSSAYGYKVWKDEEDMSDSIRELSAYVSRAFPNYKITSYIPPSNVLSEEGRRALKAAWPDLTVISSVYREDMTGLGYVQEFEVAKDGIIEMPRITSGYFESGFDRWSIANTVTELGYFSHFAHPDDVISEDRSNNLGWKEMYDEFDQYMARIKGTYPWLRANTSTDAAYEVANTLQMQVEWKHTKNRLEGHISNYAPNQFYILRTDKKLNRLEHCEATKIDTHTYLIEAKKADFKIDLGES